MSSNYPPGVSGMEPEIVGYDYEEQDCAYCKTGIAEVHTCEGHVCIECGVSELAVDNQGRCVPCISMAQMVILMSQIEMGAK